MWTGVALLLLNLFSLIAWSGECETTLLLEGERPSASFEFGKRSSALRVGDRVGEYEIVDMLATGGMAQVFLGRTADGREAAAKVPTELTVARQGLGNILMWKHEEDVLTGAANYSYGDVRAAEFLGSLTGRPPTYRVNLIERLHGPTLVRFAKEGGRVPFGWFRDLAGFMVLLRQKGVLKAHLDLKLNNLMVEGEELVVIDPGFADMRDPVVSHTYNDLNTLRQSGVEADTMAIAAMMYWVLMGKNPYQGFFESNPTTSAEGLGSEIRGFLEVYPRISLHNPSVPRELREIIHKGLVQSNQYVPHQDRYRMEHLRDDLTRFLKSQPGYSFAQEDREGQHLRN